MSSILTLYHFTSPCCSNCQAIQSIRDPGDELLHNILIHFSTVCMLLSSTSISLSLSLCCCLLVSLSPCCLSSVLELLRITHCEADIRGANKPTVLLRILLLPFSSLPLFTAYCRCLLPSHDDDSLAFSVCWH